MRLALRRIAAAAPLAVLASLFVLGRPAEVRAQTVFCPSNLPLTNGSCTDGTNGAFSGAALAGQALSELSETSSQETTKNVGKIIGERREQERQRCPEGFRREGGTCEKIPAPVTEAAPPPAPPPEERVVKKAKKPKAAVAARKPAGAPAVKKAAVTPLPPPAPPALMPVSIEAPARFGTWAQVYGDYQKRDAAGPGILTCCLTSPTIPLPGGPPALELSVQSRTGTVGFLAGADLTSRGVIFPDDGAIAGVTVGYVSSNLDLNASSFPTAFKDGSESGGSISPPAGISTAHLHANLSGPSAGLYATYFNGGFSSDFTLRVDALDLNQNFNELAFTVTNTAIPPLLVTSSGGSVSLLNATVAGNLNYRFDLYPNFWIEPTVGAVYTNSSYGGGASQLGLADGDLVRVQGGARFGITSQFDNVLATTVLTGLAYDDVLVSGGFIPVGALAGNNLLVQSDQGFVRGLGILALNLDYGNGLSSFVQGDVYGGAHLIGAGGKAGIRYQW